jgi:ankyrin repeat protein
VSNDLVEAIAEPDPEWARALAAKKSALMAVRDKDGLLPAMHALYAGDHQLALSLLPADSALTAHEAAAFGRTERLHALLDDNPKLVRSWSRDGFTPLHLALFSGEEEALRLLIDRGADVEAPSRHRTIRGVRPLHTAAFVRERRLGELLLDAGAEVDGRGEGGATALHSAAQHGDEEFVRLLLDHGADPAIRDDTGKRPADYAREAGFDELAALLA